MQIMEENHEFIFSSYHYDESKLELSLNYKVDSDYEFVEKITFIGACKTLSETQKLALDNCCKYLHIAAGVSYYKAFVANNIKVTSFTLSQDEAEFFNEFYLKGLGEFSWRNNINLHGRINFPFDINPTKSVPSNEVLPNKTVVPIGGGKDSVVTLETLRNSGVDVTPIALGRPKAIADCIRISGLPSIEVKREISPLLLELNKEGKVLNGHIPVTGVIAFILACGAVLYGYNRVAMSNERSANVGNIVRHDGFEINHQWSKSFEFEESINNFFKQKMLANFEYFSFLRPLSELGITSRFAKLEQYHDVFTSCNRAFRIIEANRIEHWCGECDKCRFVFLALAPFMNKQKLVEIFGYNLLGDSKNLLGYEELLELSSHKPFECVGEVEECVVALSMLHAKPEWKDDLLVKDLYLRAKEKYGDKILQWQKDVFALNDKNLIPQDLRGILC